MRRQRIIFLLVFLILFSSVDIYAASYSIPKDVSIEDEMVAIKTDLAQTVDEELYLPPDDIDLIALVCLGEAEGESELGKRLVIDTILNRMDSERWPNIISEVCWQRGQYGCLHNGRCKRCTVNDYIRELVREEMGSRTNTEVIYFSAGGYNGSPLFQEGGHYFSK